MSTDSLLTTTQEQDKRPDALSPGSLSLLSLMFGGFIGLGLLDGGGSVLWADVLVVFGVSKGIFGLLSGLGLALAFPLLLFGGRLVERVDNRLLLALAFLGMGVACLGFLSGRGGIAVFALILLIRSLSVTLLDLANNALAMDFERATNRHVMSPLHAGFSGGTLAGAGLVWLVFAGGGGFRAVYLGLAVIMGMAMCWAIYLSRTTVLPHQRQVNNVPPSMALALLKRPDIRLFAILTGLSFGGEALISQWAAIYLRDERDFSARIGVFAIAAYGFSMFVGRVTNGPISNRLGKRLTIMLQGGVTLVGGVLIFTGGPAIVAIVGCGLAGLGLAGPGPLALSLAGAAVPHAPGAASGATLAGGYLGFAGAPILAGIIATTASTRGVMVGVALAGVLIVFMALRMPKGQDDASATGTAAEATGLT